MSSAPSKPQFDFSSFGQASFLKFQRHDLYYLDFVEFLVEECLFKVPRYHFDKGFSSFWRSIPPSAYIGNVIKLEGIQKSDFVALLKYLYPLGIGYSTETKTPNEWKAILSLTLKWNMRDHFKHAMEASKKEPLSVQVYVARASGAAEWLSSSYIALVKRDDFFSIEEARHIGLDAILKLSHIREKYYKAQHGRYPSGDPLYLMAQAQVNFGSVIKKELSELKDLNGRGVRRSVVEQVMIGKQHGVIAWVEQGYRILLRRDEPLSLDEGAILGLEITMDICRTRETMIRLLSPMSLFILSIDLATEVAKAFKAELEDVKKEGNLGAQRN